MKPPRISTLLSLLALAIATPAVADPDPFLWPTGLEEAWEASSASGRPLIVYVKDSV